MRGAPIRVIVADDHPMYRLGVVQALSEHPEIDVVAEVGDGEEALAEVRRLSPDLALLDLRLPSTDGRAILEALIADSSATRVVFLSAFGEASLVHRLLASGAAGYLSKDADDEEILQALLAAAQGETVVSRSLQAAVFAEIREQAAEPEPVLSPREHEIVILVARGESTAAIGAELHLSPATVKTYLSRAYEKLSVSDRSAAVAEAFGRGLIE